MNLAAAVSPNVTVKDPDDRLDYAWTAADWLTDGDTITSHEFIVPESDTLTVDDSSVVDGVVIAWISGGNRGTDVNVTCRITTAQGRTKDATVKFMIRDR
ncbi:hypothetical protein G1H11_14080 [Phytoactinopolyspora alkaliphila]|uniref:Ig-like domain-containing protein n=1 Tax=Phytoactinopolyspora alkaliphila TaxID=1783498 RepID=A0A6N9YN81_9ACTN|nr:hypothetical protein [Phytoactinopolyspora alkaliphila]NED96434.1 hypothetical protein [Phytoactinopolyspora alkaliphila]